VVAKATVKSKWRMQPLFAQEQWNYSFSLPRHLTNPVRCCEAAGLNLNTINATIRTTKQFNMTTFSRPFRILLTPFFVLRNFISSRPRLTVALLALYFSPRLLWNYTTSKSGSFLLGYHGLCSRSRRIGGLGIPIAIQPNKFRRWRR
jgi:hypothetical protein